MAKTKDTTNSVSVKPIIFSGEMVRALLEGRKTQTRRYAHAATERAPHNATWAPDGGFKRTRRVGQVWSLHSPYLIGSRLLHGTARCPYKPGDLLWVRETWSHTGQGVWKIADVYQALGGDIVYRADEETGSIGYFPSIHMPRWASRLTLRVTNVRAERLQDISEDDARAEGVHQYASSTNIKRPFNPDWKGSYMRGFQAVWDTLYGTEHWDANPWVWVYEFEVIRKNVGEVN